jgi:hypothetical protein
VQNAESPYDVAALNNLYGSAAITRRTVDMTLMTATAAPETSLNPDQQQRLASVLSELRRLGSELEGDPQALLALLRQLEQLHRNLQDGAFRSSLPADRGELFDLLRAMEQSGGWPYIPRLQLRTFMDLLQRDRPEDEHPLAA